MTREDQKRILIIEDDDDIREIICYVLNLEGFKVYEHNRGLGAIEQVEQIHPDLILLDVILGDADGRDICKELKARPDTSKIPVIIISATHGWHTAHQKYCGANDYIQKPFDMDHLIEKVKDFAYNG